VDKEPQDLKVIQVIVYLGVKELRELKVRIIS